MKFKIGTLLLLLIGCQNSLSEIEQTIQFRVEAKSGDVTKSDTPYSGNLYLYRVVEGEYSELFSNSFIVDKIEDIDYLKPLYLPRGHYFISLLLSSSVAVAPSKTDQKIAPNSIANHFIELENFTHYLWWGEELIVDRGDLELTPSFKQIGALLTVEIEADSDYTNLQLDRVAVSIPDDEGVLLNLIEGEVESSTAALPYYDIEGSGLKREIYLLPSTEALEAEFTISLKYGDIEYPSISYYGELIQSVESGYQYRVKVRVDPLPEKKIVIEVKGWSEIEERIIFTKIEELTPWGVEKTER